MRVRQGVLVECWQFQELTWPFTRIVLSYPQAPTSTSSAMWTICCSRGITARPGCSNFRQWKCCTPLLRNRPCLCQWGDTPPSIAPCIDAPCARCDGSLGGFKFPFLQPHVVAQSLVQEGATALEAWAAYPGCYAGDCLSEAMVAEAGSGLRAQDMSLPLESGATSFEAWLWPKPQRGGFSVGGWTMGGGTSLWAAFVPPTAVTGLNLFAHHVASTNAKPAPSVAAKGSTLGGAAPSHSVPR